MIDILSSKTLRAETFAIFLRKKFKSKNRNPRFFQIYPEIRNRETLCKIRMALVYRYTVYTTAYSTTQTALSSRTSSLFYTLHI